jgi:acyl carrier protein
MHMDATREEIEKKAIAVLAEKSCVDNQKISLTSVLVDDLGMDSLDAVEAVFSFEEEYGMEIPDDDIRKFKTVGDIVDYLFEKMSEI